MIDATVLDQKEIQAGDNPILAAALRYLAAGLCPLPTPLAGDDQKLKRPDPRRVHSWGRFTRHLPLEQHVRRWFAGIPQGICLVTGPVSGHLKVLDFDDHGCNLGDTFQRWSEIVRGRVPDLHGRLYVGQTPGRGYRVAFRCDAATGYRTRLAMAAKDDCLIELLDDGHVVMVPGGDPRAHETGLPYTTLQGDLLDLPVLTAEQQQVLFGAGRQLNRWTPPEEPKPDRPPRPVQVAAGDDEDPGGRPGDQFNAEADWDDILAPHGWILSHHQGEIDHWTRPGKDPGDGASATTNYAGSNLLYCFSANAHPFEPDRSYTPFAAFALLNHGGDFAEAARQLADHYAERQWGGDPAPGSPAARIRAGDFDPISDDDGPPRSEDERPPGRRGFRLNELRDLRPPRWLVRRHLTANSLGCLYGPSGAGKSFVAIELAMAVASGRAYLGLHDVLRGPVVYLSGEGTAGIECRFRAWCRHHRQEPPDNLLVVPFQFDLLSPAEVEELLALIGRDLDEPPALVIVDTVNRYFGTADENNTRDMTAFVRAADRVRHATGGAVLLVHHTGKDGQKGERGNSALRAACDAMLLVDDSDHHQGALLSCTKQKEAPPFDGYVVRRRVVGLGQDPDGEPVTSCVLEPQDAVRTAYQLLPRKDKERLEGLWEKFGANPFGCNEGAACVGWTSGGASRAFRRWHQLGLLDAREGRYRVSAASRAVLER